MIKTNHLAAFAVLLLAACSGTSNSASDPVAGDKYAQVRDSIILGSPYLDEDVVSTDEGNKKWMFSRRTLQINGKQHHGAILESEDGHVGVVALDDGATFETAFNTGSAPNVAKVTGSYTGGFEYVIRGDAGEVVARDITRLNATVDTSNQHVKMSALPNLDGHKASFQAIGTLAADHTFSGNGSLFADNLADSSDDFEIPVEVNGFVGSDTGGHNYIGGNGGGEGMGRSIDFILFGMRSGELPS